VLEYINLLIDFQLLYNRIAGGYRKRKMNSGFVIWHFAMMRWIEVSQCVQTNRNKTVMKYHKPNIEIHLSVLHDIS
jgi:hypothetical protein